MNYWLCTTHQHSSCTLACHFIYLNKDQHVQVCMYANSSFTHCLLHCDCLLCQFIETLGTLLCPLMPSTKLERKRHIIIKISQTSIFLAAAPIYLFVVDGEGCLLMSQSCSEVTKEWLDPGYQMMSQRCLQRPRPMVPKEIKQSLTIPTAVQKCTFHGSSVCSQGTTASFCSPWWCVGWWQYCCHRWPFLGGPHQTSAGEGTELCKSTRKWRHNQFYVV